MTSSLDVELTEALYDLEVYPTPDGEIAIEAPGGLGETVQRINTTTRIGKTA